MTRPIPVGAALVLAAAACGAPSPSPSTAPASSTAPPSVAVPAPGRPFDAETLLAAMRDSRRPEGVPDAIETEAVATALAGMIWTLDGQPWTTVSTGGSCGPAACTLEIAGSRPDAQSDDLWVFNVSPTSGEVELVSAELRSLPSPLLAPLDELARSLVDDTSLDGLELTSARWLPPPDDGQFVLSYRSGGEEGSCGADITLDAARPGLVASRALEC